MPVIIEMTEHAARRPAPAARVEHTEAEWSSARKLVVALGAALGSWALVFAAAYLVSRLFYVWAAGAPACPSASSDGLPAGPLRGRRGSLQRRALTARPTLFKNDCTNAV